MAGRTASCPGIKADGSRCEGLVTESGYCYAHDPEKAATRRRNNARAARIKNSPIYKEIEAEKKKLREVWDAVRTGEISERRGTTLQQLSNTIIAGIREQQKAIDIPDVYEMLDEYSAKQRGKEEKTSKRTV